MKKLILTLLALSVFPTAASAMPVKTADTLTGESIADNYVAGKLENRLQELGTNMQTKEFTPAWRWTQEAGIRHHCVRVFKDRKTDASACGELPVKYQR